MPAGPTGSTRRRSDDCKRRSGARGSGTPICFRVQRGWQGSGGSGVCSGALLHERRNARTDLSPAGVCRACRNVQRGAHPDVETFSLDTQAMLADKPGRGSTLTIETVRRLRSSGALFPLESDRRILIVDDAETLLEPAQQALLKTLEEPPQGVTLMLLADEPEALLETVRSRCQEIPLRPIPQAAVTEALLRRGVADTSGDGSRDVEQGLRRLGVGGRRRQEGLAGAAR